MSATVICFESFRINGIAGVPKTQPIRSKALSACLSCGSPVWRSLHGR